MFARRARQSRQCNCDVLGGERVAEDSFSGVIRTQDVRVTETDKIGM